MEDAPREPCPWCREPAAVDARVCPHCRRSLLVDLFGGPIADSRDRYLAARDLARLRELGASVPQLLGQLSSGESLLASGISRGAAAQALAILGSHGSRGRVLAREEIDPQLRAPQYESLIGRRALSDRLILLVPAALAAGLLFWLLRSTGREHAPQSDRASSKKSSGVA